MIYGGVMSVFDRTPLERIANDLKYFWDCCVVKKKREERFREIFKRHIDNKTCQVQPPHCQYWFTNIDMRREYKKISKEPCMDRHTIQMKYAKYIYEQFENRICPAFHREFCIYDVYEESLRIGIKKLGKTLHALCHAPFELIQYRILGLNLSYEKIFEKFKNAEDKKDEKLKTELNDKGKYFVHKGQYIQHYFELLSLRDTISEEIKLQERQTSNLIGWMGFFGSLLVTLSLSSTNPDVQKSFIGQAFFTVGSIEIKLIFIFLAVLWFLFLASFIWYIWASIRLNEAKDVMYICLGFDVDNPEPHITSDPLSEVTSLQAL